MKKIIQGYINANTILKIAVGLIIGVIIGIFVPGLAFLGFWVDIFTGILKAIAPMLVFVLVISALANAGNGIGSNFKTVIILYMLSTFLASFVSVIASTLFPVTLKLTEASAATSAPEGIGEVLKGLIMNMIENPIKALSDANYTGILFWAVLLGSALKLTAGDTVKNALKNIADAVTVTVSRIILFAPFGIMGLVYSSVSENGIGIFTDYASLLILLISCMIISALVINPLIVGICLKRNPFGLVIRCLKDSGITAFFTRSSAANIPVNMALCEKLGLDRNMYSVSIPLGATINMNGAAVTITVMTLAAAHTVGVRTNIPTALILSVIATLAACGSSGVAGGSLLLIPMACSLFNISNDIAMQVVAVGFIIGVVQDSFETALNSSGDVLFAATAEFMKRKNSRQT